MPLVEQEKKCIERISRKYRNESESRAVKTQKICWLIKNGQTMAILILGVPSLMYRARENDDLKVLHCSINMFEVFYTSELMYMFFLPNKAYKHFY